MRPDKDSERNALSTQRKQAKSEIVKVKIRVAPFEEAVKIKEAFKDMKLTNLENTREQASQVQHVKAFAAYQGKSADLKGISQQQPPLTRNLK